MKKIVLIPDSFKGTLSSKAICRITETAIRRHYPDIEIISVPLADGGEGTVDSFLTAAGGERIECTVDGPYLTAVDAFYGILPDQTAVIEMAAAAGLPLVEDEKNPGLTTTFGVGQLIDDAIRRGCRTIILGLGGSATNDFACGVAAALGAVFYNSEGLPFLPTGDTLADVHSIDLTELHRRIEGVEIIAICDIDNPLTGPRGAAAVFGPQKGADPEMVERLDRGLASIARLVKHQFGVDVDSIPGAGAAGGMGGGMLAFVGAELKMGVEVVLDLVDFETLITDADLVITGEGKVDDQSLGGKAIVGVARRAKQLNVPVIVLAGGLPSDDEAIYESGVTALISINRNAEDFSVARFKTEENLAKTVDSIMRLLKGFARD